MKTNVLFLELSPFTTVTPRCSSEHVVNFSIDDDLGRPHLITKPHAAGVPLALPVNIHGLNPEDVHVNIVDNNQLRHYA